MLIAKVEDGQVINVSDYRDMFPNTSFPASGPDAEFLEANSCMMVTVWKTYNQLTEKLASVAPYIEENTVYTIAVEPLTPEEIEANTQSQWSKVRAQRDTLLQSCDWTQLPDVPLDTPTKEAWVLYRQQLRDVTSQSDPYNIVWPVAPGAEKVD